MQLLLNGSWSQNTDRKHCYNILLKKKQKWNTLGYYNGEKKAI